MFLITYSEIFGSQLHFVESLYNNAAGIPKQVVKSFFENDVISHWPNYYKAENFEDWLDFLIRKGLIVRPGEMFTITDLGREFYLFLVQYSLDKGKPK